MFFGITKEHYQNVILPREKLEKDDPKAFMFMFTEPEKKGYKTQTGKDGKLEALINVSGELGSSRFWGTPYADIQENIKEAVLQGSERIVLEINSPGGRVDGVEETAQLIRSIKVETVARVGYMAASAAYWLACACDKIEATTKISSFGSIGVIVSYYDWKEYLESIGIKEVIITSTDAPKKYIDPATEEGKLEVIERLDKIHNIFVEGVAKGRNTTPENVNKNFGQGALLIAEDAIKAGMIDTINHNILEETEMENNIKAEDITAAVEQAVAAEKSNTLKHLKYAVKGVSLEKITTNIAESKPFADCVEDYSEELIANSINKERTENQEQHENLKGEGDDAPEGLNSEKLKAEAKKLIGLDI